MDEIQNRVRDFKAFDCHNTTDNLERAEFVASTCEVSFNASVVSMGLQM